MFFIDLILGVLSIGGTLGVLSIGGTLLSVGYKYLKAALKSLPIIHL